MSTQSDKELAYAICDWLKSKTGLNEDEVGATVASLEKVFGVDTNSAEDFAALSFYPTTTLDDVVTAGKEKMGLVGNFSVALEDAKTDESFASFVENVAKRGFFDGCEEGSVEYLKRQAKLVKKFQDKAQSGGAATKAKKEKDEAAAEEEKGQGNAAMVAKDYDLAIKHYTEAISLSKDGPNSHVYLSNRAAAYCNKKDYQMAVNDCEAAIALQPTYGKAVSRLGLSYYFLGNYEKAVESYEMSVSLEPDNKASAEALEKAKKKLNKTGATPSRGSRGGPTPPGGTPDLSSLMGALGGGGGGGGMPDGMGGMPPGGLQGLLDNPAMMSMAQEMMKNPAAMAKAQEMMKDPAAMQKAMSMMGGMGGMGGGGSNGDLEGFK
jgi:small glutamine-rich tetratricopeptide repeat-containing protein alpha